MYCPSCGKEVIAGLAYCNHCGHRLNGARFEAPASSDVKPEVLLSSMVALFIFGLLAIAVLVGVMKRVDFDVPFISVIAVFSLSLLLIIEGFIAWMLMRGKKIKKEAGGFNPLNGQIANEMYAAPTRELSESTFQPVSSVSEHTTRTLDHIPKNNQ